MWPHPDVQIPREEFLEKVKGVDGLVCMITEKIDEELLDAAGTVLTSLFTA